MFLDLLRLSRPLNLVLAALTYLLGSSIPAYLGKPSQPSAFWLFFGVVLLGVFSMSLLAEVFRSHSEPLLPGETLARAERLRSSALYAAIAGITACVVLVYFLFINLQFSTMTLVFALIFFLLAFAYAVPPFRLLDRGFGELTLAAQIAYVIPSIGFLERAPEGHRLLIFVTIPLTLLALAYFLVLDFPSFASDQKYERATLLQRLTWQRAVPLHHALLLAAYVSFACAPLLGFSLKLLWPALLTLPFALFQIAQLRAIAMGARPNWMLLTATALAVIGLTTYFLTLTFWIR